MPRPSKKTERKNKILWFLKQHQGLSNIRTISTALNIPYASCYGIIHMLASENIIHLQSMNNGLLVLVSLLDEL